MRMGTMHCTGWLLDLGIGRLVGLEVAAGGSVFSITAAGEEPVFRFHPSGLCFIPIAPKNHTFYAFLDTHLLGLMVMERKGFATFIYIKPWELSWTSDESGAILVKCTCVDHDIHLMTVMATLSHSESRRSYSWWWDSHLPKNSKWLQENLTGVSSSSLSLPLSLHVCVCV
ncbi:hypothetical protein ACSQ67_002908 [Phaseolus vulgaris]